MVKSSEIPLLHWILLRRILLFTTLLLPGLAAAAPQRIQLAPATLVETPYQPTQLVRSGDRFYFQAEDPQHGRELWESDGTAAGTRRLTDLCPGACSPDIEHLQALDGRLFFTTADYGTRLHLIDGGRLTTLGLVASPVRQMVAAGDALYLRVDVGDGRTRILRSRGEAGDIEIFDELCEPSAGAGCAFEPIAGLDGHLFYLKQGFFQRVSPAGAVQRLAEVQRAQLLAELGGGRILFWGCASANSCAIYRSDGTAAGTSELAGGDAAGPSISFQYWNGALYWVRPDRRVAFTDGSAISIVPGLTADALIAATPGHLFYSYGNSQYRYLNCYSASSAASASLLKYDRFGLEVVGVLGESIVVSRRWKDLHVSDCTPGGTRLLGDLIFPAFDSAAVVGGRLYAPAYRGEPAGARELYTIDSAGGFARTLPPRLLPRADGAEALANTSVVARGAAGGFWRLDPLTLAAAAIPAMPDLEVQAASGDRILARGGPFPHSYYGLGPGGVETLPIEWATGFADGQGGRFYWGESAVGEVLWESDGTVAGSRPLFDFSPGEVQPPCSYHCGPRHPHSLRVDGDKIYLVADAEPGSSQAALWVYDRGQGRPTRLLTIQETILTDRPVLMPVAGKLVFTLDNPDAFGNDIWLTDGTPAGTYLLQAYDPRQGNLGILGAAGARAYFAGELGQLWSSDLAPGHFDLLLDPQGAASIFDGVAAVGDRLFFTARNLELGPELWSTDGTRAGTRALDLSPGPNGSWPRSLVAAGGRLVLAADRGSHGMELYQTDGTLEGTTLLADIAPGETPSSPSAIRAVGERLFFTADDGSTGRGLWSMDLPAPRPDCPGGRLCLRDGRFEVTVTAEGQALFEGRRVLASAESGVFSFFTPNNWELLVKVLDGCALNQRFWVYSAALTDLPYAITVLDRATGEQREYRHAGGGPAAPALDSDAFATCSAPAPPSAWGAILPAATPAPRCADEPDAFCFGPGGRFRARATWQAGGEAGTAKTTPYGSQDSGIFTFFSPSNWELMIKVLDGCAINGRHWVFAAGTTDVGWQLEIEDRLGGEIRSYDNPGGAARLAVTDSGAFTCG